MSDIDPEYFFDETEPLSVGDAMENHPEDGFTSDDAFMFGAAIGLGTMLAEEELDERKIRERLLKKEEQEPEIETIPLSSRFHGVSRRKSRPVIRWLTAYFAGRKKHSDPLDYTEDEMRKIIEQEGLDE
ncbi:MAG: hypothetical protein ACK419_04250 [Pyrinomonadaceae bacterium]